MAKQKELPPEVPVEGPGAPAGEQKPPKFETPTPADAGGPVPRKIKPIERASGGLVRYKIRCADGTGQKIHYILARSEPEARAHYLKLCALPPEADKALVVTTLPD